MSDTWLVLRFSISPGLTMIRWPSAVLITSRSGVSSTARPVIARPSVMCGTVRTAALAIGEELGLPLVAAFRWSRKWMAGPWISPSAWTDAIRSSSGSFSSLAIDSKTSYRASRLAEDVVGRLLQLGGVEMVHHLPQEGYDLVAVNTPGQAQIFRERRGGLIGSARGDEGLVAIDREERRQRDLGVPAGSLQVKLTVERAIEEAREEAARSLLERQAEGFEIPAVLAVP